MQNNSSQNLKQKTVHGVVWSSIERFSVQGVQFVLQIVMARILSPEDYGVIGMLSIFIAISQSLIDSGFSNALIQKKNRTEIDFATVFYFNIVVGIVLYLVLFFTSPIIASFYNTPILIGVTRIVALNLLFNSLTVVQRAKLTINIDFKTQAKASFTAVVISGVIGIILAYKGFGVWSLAVQSALNYGLNMLLLWVIVKWHPLRIFSKESFRGLFSYGSKLLASGLLDTTYKNIYTIVIGKIFSAGDLGYYTRADQFCQFPSSNLTGILQRVTFPILSEIQDDDERLRNVYHIYLRVSAFVIFPLMLGLAVVARPLILLLLTEKWEGIIPLLQILCFSEMWYPIHAINLNVLQVKGRSDLFLRLEMIKKGVGILALCVTIPFGITVMCFGRVLQSLFALIINTYYTGKIIHVGFFTQMKDLLPTFFYSASMCGVVYIVTVIVHTVWLQLLLGIFAGSIYYICISKITKSSELKILLSIIKGKRR